LAARLAQGAFLFLLGAYCLLAYLPFTYHQIHQGNLLPWLNEFGRLAPLLWWPITGLAAWTVFERRRMVVSWLYAGLHALAGLLLILWPLSTQLQTPSIGLAWCLIAFGSLAWTGSLDWMRVRGQFHWPEPAAANGSSRLFAASLLSAVVLTAAYAVEALWRAGPAAKGEQALAAIFSLDAHLLFFMGLFAVLALARSIAGVLRRPAAAEFWMTAALAVCCGQFVLSRMLFPVVSFEGVRAEALAFFCSLAGVLFWSGVCAGLQAVGHASDDGLSLFLLPLTFWVRAGRGFATWGVLALVVAGGCALGVAAAGMDWNYLAQKSEAMLVWTVTFAIVYRIGLAGLGPAPLRDRTVQLLLLSIAVLGTHRLLSGQQTNLAGANMLGRYAGYNASYKVLYDWMAPREGDGDYYHLLAANTNLPRERRIAPVEVRLSDHLTGRGGPRPNIFVFVVDSMRRDYLSPFNPAVTFTPAVAAFAGESLVFENAFTRYSGTGLSEPSIWSGALLPHKQYVTPFHPMNSMEKLLDACGYRRYISVDTILGALLEPGPKTFDLDEGVLTMSYDFGHTLKKLEGQLSNRTAADGPVFAYTQPQNLHISVINRANRSVPPGESYPGFDAPYASRVNQVDAALGEFIAFLKNKGWYDNSIVILTADHGDSLGEDGRWGHAYTLVPEVLRVPLIIHLPAALKEANVFDTRDVAFLTDIAPSLYQLLGQGPLRKEEVYGKPLFAADAASLASQRRDDWLMVASYAPIYGILHRGRELYVSDAVQYREFLYGLSGGSSQAMPLAATTRRAYQDLIRRDIQALRTYYRIGQDE
jgi:hypothetical protein